MNSRLTKINRDKIGANVLKRESEILKKSNISMNEIKGVLVLFTTYKNGLSDFCVEEVVV